MSGNPKRRLRHHTQNTYKSLFCRSAAKAILVLPVRRDIAILMGTNAQSHFYLQNHAIDHWQKVELEPSVRKQDDERTLQLCVKGQAN